MLQRAALSIALTALSTTVFAASPFDGVWNGFSCTQTAVRLTITDGTVRGRYVDATQNVRIEGKVADDGSFDGGWIKGQFAGSNFVGSFMRATKGTPCRVTAERTP